MQDVSGPLALVQSQQQPGALAHALDQLSFGDHIL
jgi:hypothetical protein